MRVMIEILAFVLGLGVLFAIGRGFPVFGAMLRHPAVLILLAIMVVLILLKRGRHSGTNP